MNQIQRFFDYRITFDIPTLIACGIILFVGGMFYGFYGGYKAGKKVYLPQFDFDSKE